MLTITNEDNMELMARYPDNYFDLAIVDPPYGLGDKLTQGGTWSKKWQSKGADWDKLPNKEYFEQLIRVSKNWIIWGGNYFYLPPTRCFLIWDKQQPEDVSFASCEFAWTSLNESAKTFYKRPQNADIQRIHPTQKPVALYKWILDKYAKQGDKILDTHLGSGSIAIACHDYGFDLTACELDKEYFDKAMQRINNHVSQQKLF